MKRIIFFILLSFTIVSTIPAYNYFRYSGSFQDFLKNEEYFDLDYLIPKLSYFAYKHGISFFPQQAVVGNDGWIFLGDEHASTITSKREGSTSFSLERAEQSTLAMQEWQNYLLRQGVKDFKIWVGPDKLSIYPEKAPRWAAPAEYLKIDALLAADQRSVFVSSAPALLDSKSVYESSLFYKTDTHWNLLGAGLSFEYYMQDLASQYEVNLPLRASSMSDVIRHGGDLARFLRIEHLVADHEPTHLLDVGHHSVTQIDYLTGNVLSQGGNPQIGPSSTPVNVVSDNALNAERVLWIRDSFGTAMAPYMSATFSETLQLHYAYADRDFLVELVNDFKPDYVFVTVVERSIFEPFFFTKPPFYSLERDGSELDGSGSQVSGELLALNDVDVNNGVYEITGSDPYLIYDFKGAFIESGHNIANIEISCIGNETNDVSLQVFWTSDTLGVFTEEQSVRFSLPATGGVYDFSQLPLWGEGNDINSIRLDIDQESLSQCGRFIIQHFEFGALSS